MPTFVPNTPELIKLHDELKAAREKYATEYKNFVADRKEKAGIMKNVWRSIIGSEVPDKEIPPALKDLETEYDKAAVLYGEEMFKAKEAELASTALTQAEKDAELKKFKQYDIFKTVIIDELGKLNFLKAENLPPKEKNMFKKGLDWYLEQGKWTKRGISFALSLGFAVFVFPGSVAAVGGGGTFVAIKAARTVAGLVAGQTTGKLYDLAVKDKSEEKRKAAEEKLAEAFEGENLGAYFAKNRKEYNEILEQEKSAKRNRLIGKALTSMAVGGLASIGTGSAMGQMVSDVPNESGVSGGEQQGLVSPKAPGTAGAVPNKPEGGTLSGSNNSGTFYNHGAGSAPDAQAGGSNPAGASPETGTSDTSAPEALPIKNAFTGEVKFDDGKGAIQGILDLRKQISDHYNGDFSKAPEGIQKFMAEPSAVKLAIKLDLYDPNDVSGEESALIHDNVVMKFDEQGNLLFGKPDAWGKIPVLEKYTGDMFDSDKSGPRVTEKSASAPSSESSPENAESAATKPAEPSPQTAEKPGAQPAVETTVRNEATIRQELYAKYPPDPIDNRITMGSPMEIGTGGNEVPVGTQTAHNVFYDTRHEAVSNPQVEGIRHPFPGMERSENLELDRLLARHPEFAENRYDLPGPDLLKVVKSHDAFKSLLLPHNTDEAWTVSVKNMPADETLAAPAGEKGFGPVTQYLTKLKEITGTGPERVLPTLRVETNEEYIVRALQKAAKEGNLGKVRDSVEAIYRSRT